MHTNIATLLPNYFSGLLPTGSGCSLATSPMHNRQSPIVEQETYWKSEITRTKVGAAENCHRLEAYQSFDDDRSPQGVVLHRSGYSSSSTVKCLLGDDTGMVMKFVCRHYYCYFCCRRVPAN